MRSTRPTTGDFAIRRLLALTLFIAATTWACGEPKLSLDPELVESAPVIDWSLLLKDPSESRTQERDRYLGAGPVRIAGYLVPLEDFPLDQDEVPQKEFLLVPYAGACIHYPPPPPDQMIHVRMASGQAAILNPWAWDPLEVVGDLRPEPLDSVYGAIGYQMDGIAVREYGSDWKAQ